MSQKNGVSGKNVKVENSYKQNKIMPFWPMRFFSDEPGKKIIEDIVSKPLLIEFIYTYMH